MNLLRILIFVVAVPLFVVSIRRREHIKLTKSYCRGNEAYCHFDKCELTPINRHISYMNIEGPLKRKVNHIMVRCNKC